MIAKEERVDSYSTYIVRSISSQCDIKIKKILENITIENRHLISNHIGVYILKNDLGDYYIGFSTKIKTRLNNHNKNKAISSANIYLVDNKKDGLFLEAILINIFKPKLNKKIPYFYSSKKIFIPMLEWAILIELSKFEIIESSDIIINFSGC